MYRLAPVGFLALAYAVCVPDAPAQSQNVWQTQVQALQSQMKELQRQMNELVEANKGRPAGAMSKDEIAAMVREELSLMQKEGKLPAKPGAKDFKVFWKDGFRFNSTDGTFKMKFGGRIMSDWTWADAGSEAGRDPSVGEEHSGHEFRRARLYVAGTVYDEFEFKAQYDFAHHQGTHANTSFKDMYIGIKPNVIPGVPGVRFGHFKEPFSLEELTSSKYITFIERSMVDSMAPGRNVGIMIHNAHFGDKKHPRMTYAVGFFRDTDNAGYGRADGSYSATGRITFLPLYVDKGKYLVHVGGGVSYRDLGGTMPMANETARFRTKPENHLTPVRYIDTGAFSAENATLYNVEAAAVAGPFSIQSEYTLADVSRRHAAYGYDDASFSGCYVEASCFLTPGDRRQYKNSAGAFSRVKPVKPFSLKHGGLGAWQAAVRYSRVDFDDEEIRYGMAGTENNWTFGLNWHWTNNIRMMFNYVLARPNRRWMTPGGFVYHDTGRLTYAMVRAQIDF